jgi:hypothetical protein
MAVSATDAARSLGQQRLPSFFIVGPPRTGSSWLYEVLRPHASLPDPSKETRFFDKHFHRGLKWYLAHYKSGAIEQPRGEIAPTYFASSSARERIAETAPHAKVVCVFRNPVERIISLYRLKLAYGMIDCTLEEAIERDPELMATSRYATNLKLWRQSFGEQNIFVALYDDLQRDAQEFVDAVADFVGIPRFAVVSEKYGLVHNSEKMSHPRSPYGARTALRFAEWLRSRRLDQIVVAFKRSRLRKLVHGGGPPFRAPEAETSLRLHEMLLPEVEELEALLQRDLSAWKIPRFYSTKSDSTKSA